MPEQKILVVDDEKNIRVTVNYALESLGYTVNTAVNGEEALARLADEAHDLVLLDLRMPGMDGIDVLKYIAHRHPHTRVAIISAHGNVENAVEAMKLGAIDFIQKPFTPQELADLVHNIFQREQLTESAALDYDACLELAKQMISQREVDAARRMIQNAIGQDPMRPEGFNLLGILCEIRGDRPAAQKNYRVALDLAPNYAPANNNLHRSAEHNWRLSAPDLG